MFRRSLASGLVVMLVVASLALSRVPSRADHAPDSAKVVPFEMLPSNHMVVRAKLNGKGPFRLVFDLGSPVTLLSGKTAEASEAIPRDAPKSFLFGVRGEGKLDSIELGDLKGEDLPVVVMDHPALKALGGLFGRPLDGILGYTFFARYKMTLDYKARELTFTPVDHATRDVFKDLQARMLGPKVAKTRVLAPRGLWGLTISVPADADTTPGVAILAVRPETPAARAGLRNGDVITSIDGRWTASVADAYAAAATVPPGQRVPVVVLRDGQEQSLSITPVEGF